MTRRALGVSWCVRGFATPYSDYHIKRFVLNPSAVVSVEPEKFWFRDGPSIEGAVVFVSATADVYTKKNDDYEASLHHWPRVEVRGGGAITYLVMCPLEEAARRVSEGEPFPIPDAVADWLVADAFESAARADEGSLWKPCEAAAAVIAERGLEIPGTCRGCADEEGGE